MVLWRACLVFLVPTLRVGMQTDIWQSRLTDRPVYTPTRERGSEKRLHKGIFAGGEP